jgi:peptidoglycan/xylan/chitin deacetylase (PgdA/CDA1 family)
MTDERTRVLSTTERDFIGYGEHPAQGSWPNGAQVAISLVINYEEGSERSLAFGDPDQESGSEWGSYPFPADKRNLATESMFEYGSRVGIWRLFKLLDDYKLDATFFACALALERNPAVAQAILRGNHAVVSHGYRWEEHFRMGREEERERIALAMESFKRTLGKTPRGWYCRVAPSANTRELLVESGLFDYDCDSYNDDQPYYVKVKGRNHLVVPYTADNNDFNFWQSTGVNTGAQFFEHLKDSFDQLYSESEHCPKLMSVGLHPRMVGRPARMVALRKFIEYTLRFPRVAYMNRDDIAMHWLSKHPPTETAS